MTITEERDTRTALIETAARVLAEHGPDALTTRRLASEMGTSTMAVYTHFGSMNELRRAVRNEGFARLGRAWQAIPATRDPVADLSVSGATYVLFALRNPHLYRAMFFDTRLDDDAQTKVVGYELAIIKRCIDAGRFDPAEPWAIAWQLWAATHGIVAGVLAGVLNLEAAEQHLFTLGSNLYVGLGDNRAAAQRSMQRAQRRMRAEANNEEASFSNDSRGPLPRRRRTPESR